MLITWLDWDSCIKNSPKVFIDQSMPWRQMWAVKKVNMNNYHEQPSTSGVTLELRTQRRRSRRSRGQQNRSRSRSRRRGRSSSRNLQFISRSPRARSLSREQCQNIPTVPNNEIESGDQCSICLEELNGHQTNRKLACSHVFHETCLFTWLNGEKASCPTCRKWLMNLYWLWFSKFLLPNFCTQFCV